MVEEIAARCEIGALRSRRLGLGDRVEERPDVLRELFVAERGLADRALHDAGLLDAEFDRAALGGDDRIGDVHRHGADLRVRHQAARAEHLAETSDQRHHVGRGDAAIEFDRAALDRGDEVFGADDVRAGRARFVSLGAAGEHRDLERAARAVGQVDDAAHHLVGMLGIDAEVDREFDGLVEFGDGVGFDELDRLIELVELGADDGLAGLADSLAVLVMAYPTTSRPIERAEPSIIFIADSIDSQLRSTIFFSAISLT